MKGRVIRVNNDLPLRVHTHPFLEAPVVTKLFVGTEVEILAAKGGWFQVKAPASGKVGWVDKDFIQELPEPQPDSFPRPCEIEPVGDYMHKVWVAVLGAFLFLIAAFAISVLIFPA